MDAQRLAAAGVHVFTALGALCALMAALAIGEGAWERVFLWLGVAFVIDGVDGYFARLLDVGRWLPRFSGERLDLVVDFLTYVFIPVLALRAGGFLPGTMGLLLAAAIVLTSLFHFADVESKAEDHSFVGFPAVWNVVAFYLFAFAAPPAVAAGVVVTGAALAFVPFKWVHPLRVRALRGVTLAFTALWAIAALATLYVGFPALPGLKAVLAVVAVYGVGLALLWSRRSDG
ncbi:MAG: phosphatidylcholine synthase [Pseudomonadota bacterium]